MDIILKELRSEFRVGTILYAGPTSTLRVEHPTTKVKGDHDEVHTI
jgi:hypothetical protein